MRSWGEPGEGPLMHQPTFASVEFAQKKRKTRREVFLERLDALVPWEELAARIAPHYPRAGRGRRPYPLAVLLRIHCVQLCYNLSDPAMEDLLYEAESARRFCGLTLREPLPDETTILHFRHLRAPRSGHGTVRDDQRPPGAPWAAPARGQGSWDTRSPPWTTSCSPSATSTPPSTRDRGVEKRPAQAGSAVRWQVACARVCDGNWRRTARRRGRNGRRPRCGRRGSTRSSP